MPNTSTENWKEELHRIAPLVCGSCAKEKIYDCPRMEKVIAVVDSILATREKEILQDIRKLVIWSREEEDMKITALRIMNYLDNTTL
jgi:hypothetical protein